MLNLTSSSLQAAGICICFSIDYLNSSGSRKCRRVPRRRAPRTKRSSALTTHHPSEASEAAVRQRSLKSTAPKARVWGGLLDRMFVWFWFAFCLVVAFFIWLGFFNRIFLGEKKYVLVILVICSTGINNLSFFWFVFFYRRVRFKDKPGGREGWSTLQTLQNYWFDHRKTHKFRSRQPVFMWGITHLYNIILLWYQQTFFVDERGIWPSCSFFHLYVSF